MSNEQPEGGQPVGQLSPDGNWRWDGHNWVPAGQPAASGAQQPQYAQQAPQPSYTPQQQSYPQQQYGQQPYAQPSYGGMPPGSTPTKKGLPTWAKILIGLLVLFVGLIALLTIVGLTMEEDYADWSCEDVGKEAVRISGEQDGILVLNGVSDLTIAEDNRKDFKPPATGRGVVLSCEGSGDWETVGEAPVLVELLVGEDGEEWVSAEMAD